LSATCPVMSSGLW